MVVNVNLNETNNDDDDDDDDGSDNNGDECIVNRIKVGKGFGVSHLTITDNNTNRETKVFQPLWSSSSSSESVEECTMMMAFGEGQSRTAQHSLR